MPEDEGTRAHTKATGIGCDNSGPLGTLGLPVQQLTQSAADVEAMFSTQLGGASPPANTPSAKPRPGGKDAQDGSCPHYSLGPPRHTELVGRAARQRDRPCGPSLRGTSKAAPPRLLLLGSMALIFH